MSYAIITGAASGIGKAAIKALWSIGYNVTGVDVQEIDIPKHPTFPAAPRWEGIKIDLAKGGFSVDYPVDVLVVSHGVGGMGRSWDRVMDVNVKGVKNAVESVLPMMKDGGNIVLVASMTGVVVGNKDMQIANYAASKGAVVGYMRQLAVELAEKNIRVNAIAPGPVVTPMTDGLKKRDPALYEEFFGRELLPGNTMPEDIAHAILFLAETKRMTGQTLIIDGGYTCW